MRGILKLNKGGFFISFRPISPYLLRVVGLEREAFIRFRQHLVPCRSDFVNCHLLCFYSERERERAYNGEGPNRARDSRFCVLVPVFLGKDARDGTEKRSLISQIRKSFVTYLSLTWSGMLDQKRSSWYICKPHSETFSWECMVWNLKLDVHYPRVIVEMNVK